MDRTKQSSKARERRLRAKYRKNLRIAIVLCLVIGLVLGFVLGRYTAPKAAAPSMVAATPTPAAEPTDEPAGAEPTADAEVGSYVQLPTAEPTAEPTAAPTPEPEVQVEVVPFGSTQNLTVQVHADGSVRKENDALSYETMNFSLRVTRYLSPEYYQETYGSTHQLDGTQTGVEFELLLNDYMGSQVIDPNKLFPSISVETASGDVELGYRLTNAEISGENNFTMTTNVPTLLYKRFDYSASVGNMTYMVVTTYVDGVAHAYKFELGAPVNSTPEPEIVYSALAAGSKGDEVMKLQQRLIELGYLAEGSADGDFGSKTADAVRAAQTAFGMTSDGIASNEFQHQLYSEDAAAN